MAEVARPWSDEEVKSEAVSKKQIIEFLQEKASSEFLTPRKLNGKSVNVAKSSGKDDLVKYYAEFFELKAFRNEDAEVAIAKFKAEEKKPEKKVEAKAEKVIEKPRYTKAIMKKGSGTTLPTKGDLVSCKYRGYLPNGTVFDQNWDPVKGRDLPLLKFKVGTGKVIRGWDEALMTMYTGEQAKLVIEPQWGYGNKGHPDAGIEPNMTLTFEVELVAFQ